MATLWYSWFFFSHHKDTQERKEYETYNCDVSRGMILHINRAAHYETLKYKGTQSFGL